MRAVMPATFFQFAQEQFCQGVEVIKDQRMPIEQIHLKSYFFYPALDLFYYHRMAALIATIGQGHKQFTQCGQGDELDFCH